MKRTHFTAAALLALAALTQSVFAAQAKLSIDCAEEGTAVSPSLYGIFFEEINRAGDGGIYGEMLENRSFEDSKDSVQAWETMGTGSISLDRAAPINERNETSVRLDVDGQSCGLYNSGFAGVGLNIEENTSYMLSLYVRAQGSCAGNITARIEGFDGAVLAEAPVKGAGADWKQLRLKLRCREESTSGRLVLEAGGEGSVWFDMVSLFPEKTWKGHGMRDDLAEMIDYMQPKFVRFPGGCFVEGDVLDNSVRWKETIGDPAQRKGNWCIWGYQTTGGFGLYEFLQWCEDLGAEPMYVINCGMSHRGNVPMDEMSEYVQDALDLIEYANGPADSVWGAKRAASGHPAPFGLKYMEIGNENGGPAYNERYALFHDAIKAKYPEIELIACVWGGTPKDKPIELIDEHYYNNPTFFMKNADKYDSYERANPKVYVGEYAVTQGCGAGNLIAALGEAAFMTGIERNSDQVAMASYAPLFVNPEKRAWNPNAIVFDQARCYGTPSYYVQAMFSRNQPAVIAPSKLETGNFTQAAPKGGISLGTWNTQAEFKDVKVVAGGKTLYESDFTKGTDGWRTGPGRWETVDGALRQTGDNQPTRAAIGSASWGGEYTVSLKARKISGSEGFLIGFQLSSDSERRWLNLGGWNNTGHALESYGNGRHVDGSIEQDHWYDIRIELKNDSIACFLDGKQIIAEKDNPVQRVYAVAGKTADGSELIVKMVNVSEEAVSTDISLDGVKRVAPKAEAIVLTSGNMNDENTFERPKNVAPKKMEIGKAGKDFTCELPARSVTVIRIGISR